MSEETRVEIFTDGACSGNPGPGGWGAVLRYGSVEREMSGGASETTNNRMELTAAVEALSALKRPCRVTLTSDSQYLTKAVNERWVFNWKRKGWMKKPGEPVPNADLWQKLLALLDTHTVDFVWVRGHNGHPENERCDRLAVAAIDRIRNSQ